MAYKSQAARDAQDAGYGDERHWTYLDSAAAEQSDYWRRQGDEGKAAEMLTRSLSEALRGNEGP
jgi:hypothetical protein